jgi:hypothetical protein
MARRAGKTHYERYRAAVAAGQDAKAEALVALLRPTDEPALLEMAGAPAASRRWWALRGLAHCGDKPTIPVVVAALADADPEVRAAAALALGSLGQRQPEDTRPYLATLAERLNDADGLVRQAAAGGLAQCGDPAVQVLAQTLAHGQDKARVWAAHALHRIGSPDAAAVLYRHLNDPNPLVRHHAHETLDRLGLLENVLLIR